MHFAVLYMQTFILAQCASTCIHTRKQNTWKTPWNLQEHKLLFAFSTKRDRKRTTTKKTHLSKIIRLGSLPKQYNVELKTRYLFMTYISNAHLYRSVLVSRSMFFVRSSCIRLFCSTLKNYWFCCMHCCTVLSCIHKYMLRTNLGYVKVSLFERKINFYNFLLYAFFFSRSFGVIVFPRISIQKYLKCRWICIACE